MEKNKPPERREQEARPIHYMIAATVAIAILWALFFPDDVASFAKPRPPKTDSIVKTIR